MRLTQEWEGEYDPESGEWKMGPKMTWEALVQDAAEGIWTEYEDSGERPPPEAVRLARANRRIKQEHPELWARYHAMRTEIRAMEKWIGQRRDSISARQSALSAEKELAKGIQPGPQPEWSGDKY